MREVNSRGRRRAADEKRRRVIPEEKHSDDSQEIIGYALINNAQFFSSVLAFCDLDGNTVVCDPALPLSDEEVIALTKKPVENEPAQF